MIELYHFTEINVINILVLQLVTVIKTCRPMGIRSGGGGHNALIAAPLILDVYVLLNRT